MVEIVLDGRRVEAAAGELIIEAAERAGVYIPRFCFHPRMKPVGMCRMCLVEVSGPRGATLQPACYIPVAEGQEISTNSPAARKAQEGVIEFLLVNHPLDCPVCDKGGECPLQDQSVSHGPGESRFVEEKRHWAKPIALGPLTLLDRERCIQCARCTRFAEEIAGEPLIDFYERGDHIEVAVFPDRPFDSYFSGNTVQICPVGALTSVPYRFKSRPWDLEQVESTCTYCAVGCRVAAQSSAGALVRYLGIDSEPVNQSWLCDRGRYGFEAIASPARLTTPLVRRDGELVAVGWNEALKVVAERLRQVPGDTVGIIGGARLANEDAYAWSKLARSVIGTDNIDAQLGDGLPAELVCSLPRATIEDACSAKAVVLLAGDLREELPILHLRLRAAAANAGLSIIECSPVPTGLSEVAVARLTYTAGEAGPLAEALLEPTSSAVPGVDEAELERALSVLGTALELSPDGSDIVIVVGRPSLAESSHHVAHAAATLSRAWPGARFLPALRRSNVLGAIDMGLAPGLLPGRVSLEEGADWYGSFWGSLPRARGLDTAAMLGAAANAGIGTLILLGADPRADFPDRHLATQGLDAVPFLVSIDAFLSTSSSRADVVLPVGTSIERAGSTTNIEGRVTRLAQKVVAPGQARPDWIIAVEIAGLLGHDLGFEDIDAIWEEIESVAPSHRGCTLRALGGTAGADGIVVPLSLTAVTPRQLARLDPMATPGITSVDEQGAPLYAGTVAEAGTTAPDGSDDGSDPKRPPVMRLSPEQFPAPVPLAPEGLRLVTKRSLYDNGTLVQAAASLARLVPDQVLRISPGEMDRLGAREGALVKVRSRVGELEVPVAADRALPDGLAVMALGTVPPDRPGVADLIDSSASLTDVVVEAAW
ncbi:MAG: NADH-quinone oxidoreductase subunit NuoG [Actinomycetota bacterium]|nr:NADH-quinone oxidoreductase subunit NuoG [Actinomycetota bacterium]